MKTFTNVSISQTAFRKLVSKAECITAMVNRQNAYFLVNVDKNDFNRYSDFNTATEKRFKICCDWDADSKHLTIR